MNEELRLYIKKLQIRANLSLFAILLTIVSISFGILFLFVPSFIAVIFFALAAIGIAYLIYLNHIAKKEANETIHKPVVLDTNRSLSFEELVDIFESLTDKENQLSISEDVRFFRFKKLFRLRVVLYRTADFNKVEYDNEKDRINKKANRALKISHLVSKTDARNMMRFNIICADILNEALYQFISQNAYRNLTRVEGIINIAVVNNQIIIPPLYGKYDIAEVNRYKGVIKFINQALLSR